MSTKYYLQKVPVEAVQPGLCSLTGLGGGYKRQRALCLLLDVH
ncbi:Uncharacterised protein [Mycobacterium tuberculosis]|uniref:Uncharacterized protein n=1 Tax=Mycobacterium tuberculosis TaxID=1773 RepID=A0A916LA10_MYCTX|nr:Uncharacterised protein [Mycobacterium tuberculosis]